jgi:hypothetical protein
MEGRQAGNSYARIMTSYSEKLHIHLTDDENQKY